jgi:hypothetical protein
MGADRREIAWPLRDELRAHPRPDAAMYLSAGGFSTPKGGPAPPLDAGVRVVTNEEDVRKEDAGADMGGGFSQEHDPTPAYLGWSTHIEMESMVKAGLTPREVITAATRDAAQFLGIDQLGMVAAGKNADFLVLDANPLDNIANTRRISRVYLRGGQIDRAALRTQLKGGSAAATRPTTTH